MMLIIGRPQSNRIDFESGEGAGQEEVAEVEATFKKIKS